MSSTAMFGMYTTAFSVIFGILALVAGIFLLRAYLRTQMSGLLWLLLAIVVWPLLMRISYPLLGMALRFGTLPSALTFGMPAALAMVMWETAVSSVGGGVLLIVACSRLDRQLGQRPSPLPSYTAITGGPLPMPSYTGTSDPRQ